MLEWPDAGESTRGLIDGPDGPLEVSVGRPDEATGGLVLVCHPHPQQGGTLDNKVTYMMARAAVEAGYTAVRFNFRGVGESGGGFDDGVGEVDDARAVRDWALEASGEPLAGVCGFSFGSAVALRLAAGDGAPRLVTVGFPAAYFDGAPPRPETEWLAIFGDADDVIDVDASIAAVRALEPPVDVQILAGAGHFLHGRLTDLRQRVIAFLDSDEG
ncbi:alpha/beta hydrolase [Salinisphaera orenii]|uniref:Alpha/beta hydrolase n=1 Tax=Salinisphaera orenii YIM 95161 TaxID=1051139 RepID=A0A423PYL4_9GAMM|nr:alpha/beta fold hydrolase [Salinisphaera halophila]ROO30702.1 alpha/beta hydrolase [Salinisphaera halophila YIM 95161]